MSDIQDWVSGDSEGPVLTPTEKLLQILRAYEDIADKHYESAVRHDRHSDPSRHQYWRGAQSCAASEWGKAGEIRKYITSIRYHIPYIEAGLMTVAEALHEVNKSGIPDSVLRAGAEISEALKGNPQK